MKMLENEKSIAFAKDAADKESSEQISSKSLLVSDKEREFYTPISELVNHDIQTDKPKKINLTLDNMLLASKVLSIYKNERILDLSKYPGPVKNYVARVIKNGDIDGELKRLNIQTTAKIFQENSNSTTKKVFLLYSHEDNNLKKWVTKFSKDLEDKSIQTILDVKDLALGEPLSHFVEQSIKNCDYIIVICTPYYKEKADNRTGGVSYENSIIRDYIDSNQKIIIPVLARGTWDESIPTWALGIHGVDMSTKESYMVGIEKLKATITE